MGGFAVQIPGNLPESEKFLPSDDSETWFLTEAGIHFLLNKEGNGSDEVPDLSEEDIKSKSKANGLAKGLICLQALWFIAQCLTRLAQRIPIALLELNTFGHAWQKNWYVAYWYLSWLEAPRRETDFLENFAIRGESMEYYYVPAEHGAELHRDVDVSSTTLASGQYLTGTGFKLRTFAQLIDHHLLFPTFPHESLMKPYRSKYLRALTNLNQYKDDQIPFTGLTFTDRDVTRWNMAWRAVQTCKLVEDTKENGVTQKRPDVKRLPRQLTERCDDWPTFDDLANLPILFGFSVAAFIYGGLHALAWFAHFNSNTEQLLWRASACIVMGGFPVACIIRFVIPAAEDIIDEFLSAYDGQKVWMNSATVFFFWLIFSHEHTSSSNASSTSPTYQQEPTTSRIGPPTSLTYPKDLPESNGREFWHSSLQDTDVVLEILVFKEERWRVIAISVRVQGLLAGFGDFWNRTLFSWLEMQFTINETHLSGGELCNTLMPDKHCVILETYTRYTWSANPHLINRTSLGELIIIEKVHVFNPI
ncbi:hypothetical protein G7Y79_00006g018290 [Physcia stellaris]|nr:hypothetical protein G7Y79_00006g018290 [Physcia stellaris]